MKRRNFIKDSALGSASLVIGIHLSGCNPPNLDPGVFHRIGPYLEISTNSQITIHIPVPEIGQGVRTSLSMMIMEELGALWEQVSIKQCDAGPDFGKGNQRAAGSNSVRIYLEPLRRAGAQARHVLKQSAALLWDISPEDCAVADGRIVNRYNRLRFTFGQLVEQASRLNIPEEVELKESSNFEYIGRDQINPDTKDIVTGNVDFGMDIIIPNMLYASIERCPTYGGSVKSFDPSEALKIKGVQRVFKVSAHGSTPERPYTREGVAVVGTSTWAVLKGRQALTIEWDHGLNKDESTKTLHRLCDKLIDQNTGDVHIDQGDVYRSLDSSTHLVEALYKVPLIAHVPMEPVNCTIDLKEESCELWSGTQMPYAEWQFLTNYLEMPEEKIKLHVPRIGGGFGKRLGIGATIEAVKVAQEIKKPVKLFWTREDDLLHDSYRPFSYHKMKAGINNEGNLISWLHRQAGTSRYAFRSNERPGNSEFFPNHFPANLLPNFRQEYLLAESNIPRSLIRAPGNNALAFVVESFMDELAHYTQNDPIDFRLEMLGKDREFIFNEEDQNVISTGRMKAVLNEVARKSDWHKRFDLEDGRGMGIAAYFTFDTYVTHVAEVSIDRSSGKLSIHKFVSVVDCGLVVNPAGVRAQVEGSIQDGLSATLGQEITIENGVTMQSNFHQYNIMRIGQSPDQIEVYHLDSDYPPTGMGEPPYPPVAPALCNAIFDAIGLRIRSLPIGNQISDFLSQQET